MIKWILFNLLILSSLECENYCSSHGKCGTRDVCSCFMGWGGICPFGEAFADTPLGNINHARYNTNTSNKKYATEWTSYGINPDLSGYVTENRFHRYAECSNSGICNRKTGECTCLGGYEGSACERRSCPTSSSSKLPCNGHGKCISNYEKYIDYNDESSYYGWELEKFYSCICDEGFAGNDCSLRTCPIGYSNIDSDTKLTYEVEDPNLDDIIKKGFYFKVEYKNGKIYKTQSIVNDDYDTIEENINTVLKIVPGFAINNVTVEYDSITRAKLTKLQIEFRLIDPNIVKMSIIGLNNHLVSVSLEFKAYPTPPGDLKSAECSNKGICDTTTGECECLNGYNGSACEIDEPLISTSI